MVWGKRLWAGLVLAAGIVLPGSASADWSATGSVGETVEANDNPQLESKSPGGAVGSITNLSLQGGYEWPTMKWTVGTDLGFSKFWGPGAQDSLDGLRGGVLTTSLAKTTPLTNYNASFSGSVLPASVSELFDSGITNANTTTVSYFGQGGLTHQLNELNALGLSVSGASESFINNGSGTSAESDALKPNTYLTAGQSWIRNVTPLTNFTVAASTGWYTAEGVGSTDSVSESITAQLQTQLYQGWSLTAGGGGNVVFAIDNSDSISTDNSNSTSTGFIANVAVGYALPTTTVSAFASHNLAPSSLGTVEELTQAGLSVGHQINGVSSVFLSGIFVYQLPVFSIDTDPNQKQQRQGLVLSVGYQRLLTQYWNLSLNYSFSEQNNGDSEFFQALDNQGSSTSNAVFATITRSFNLLSYPANDVALQEKTDWMGGAWPGRPKTWAANP
jgi:hypothetical protein